MPAANLRALVGQMHVMRPYPPSTGCSALPPAGLRANSRSTRAAHIHDVGTPVPPVATRLR